METVTDSQELVVWAEKGALAEAKDTFSRFDAFLPNDSICVFEEGYSRPPRFRSSICATRSPTRNLNPF
jgi:hypothetical protein